MSSQTINKGEPANLLAHRKGWHWVRLGDHVSKIGSGLTPLGGHASYQASGIPLIRSQNVHMNCFEPDGLAFISTEQDEAMSVSRVQPGDVLLNITGASIGRVCVAPSERCPANVNQHVCVIRGDGSLDSEFVAFFLASPEFQSFIWETQAGATRQALTKALVEDFRIPFTSLEEQRRIAGRLREQLAEVAKARTAVQAQLAAAQALPAACLMHVFDSPTATNWKTETIRDLSTLVIDGPHITPQYVESGVPFLTIRNIVTRKINMTNVSYVSREDHTEFASRGRAERGDILYSKDGTLGIPCVVDTDAEFSFFVSVALIKLRRDLVVPRFVAAALESPKVLAQVASLGAGAGLKHMVLKSIRALEIPVPSLDDQHGIVARLAAEFAEVTQLRESLSGKLETLDRLPAALLAQAFQGGQ